jgi:hypothetical protein
MFIRPKWIGGACLSALLSFVFPSVNEVCAQTPVPEAPAAKALVQAMQVQESVRIALEASVQRDVQQGRFTQKVLDCVKTSNLDFATDTYAAAVAAALSPQEIKQAMAFFSSAEGRGYLKYSAAQELQARGLSGGESVEMSPKEYSATSKFLDSNAGKKLLQDRVHETAELKASVARGMAALLGQCRR